jgi:hypothetical protein
MLKIITVLKNNTTIEIRMSIRRACLQNLIGRHMLTTAIHLYRTSIYLSLLNHHPRGGPFEISVGAGLANPPTTDRESSGLSSSSTRGDG